jgi:hypothetical protein
MYFHFFGRTVKFEKRVSKRDCILPIRSLPLKSSECPVSHSSCYGIVCISLLVVYTQTSDLSLLVMAWFIQRSRKAGIIRSYTSRRCSLHSYSCTLFGGPAMRPTETKNVIGNRTERVQSVSH